MAIGDIRKERIGGVQKGYKHPLVAAKDLFHVGDVEKARKMIVRLSQSTKQDIALKASELIIAYSYGKPIQAIQHSGNISLLIDE